MNKKIIGVLFAVFLLNTIHAADSDGSQAITDGWGDSVCGAQLTIGLENEAVTNNSTFILTVHVKNISTNFISIVEVDSTTDFSVYLIKKSGEKRKLTSSNKNRAFDRRVIHKLKTGEVCEYSMPVKIGKYEEAGDYELQATRSILTDDNKVCTLTSNSLEIKVMK